mmetsp:Transcript_4818/g.8991  ORF Transcript_4818/g.8991 Transcript_4818/m.8991 type:complete len:266 (+) Transcript_4818:1562-2359(+)
MSRRQITEAFFSFSSQTNILHRTNLATGEDTAFEIKDFVFEARCVGTLCGKGKLYVTGGRSDSFGEEVNWVMIIDTLRDFSVVQTCNMGTSRYSHAAAFHGGFLYVIGGQNTDKVLDSCERLDLTNCKWEPVEPLPKASSDLSVTVVEATASLFALGGFTKFKFSSRHNLIQRLSLTTQSWDLLKVKLPYPDYSMPCFTGEQSQVYFISRDSLFVFNPITSVVSERQQLDLEVLKSSSGPSLYSRGALYYSNLRQGVVSVTLGNL